MNSIIDHIIEEARTYSSTFGAFVIVFKNGITLSCKTPQECQSGIGALYYMKEHPEVDWKINTIKLPEEGGTYYWLREAP